MFATRSLVAACFLLCGTSAYAQSNLGELLDKGGKKLGKDFYAANFPATITYVWPNKLGEGEVLFKADGTLSGTEHHYSSRSNSPAVGTWTVDDDGKWCVKKQLSAWGRNTDVCWYSFALNGVLFGAMSDTDRNANIVPAGTIKK